jgi:hypothetical protein
MCDLVAERIRDEIVAVYIVTESRRKTFRILERRMMDAIARFHHYFPARSQRRVEKRRCVPA